MCGRLWSWSGRATVSLRDRSSGGTGAGWPGMLSPSGLTGVALLIGSGEQVLRRAARPRLRAALLNPSKRRISSVLSVAFPARIGDGFNERMATVRKARPRERRSDAARNHETLVRAATAALHREGPRVSLATIAAEAGVGVGTL